MSNTIDLFEIIRLIDVENSNYRNSFILFLNDIGVFIIFFFICLIIKYNNLKIISNKIIIRNKFEMKLVLLTNKNVNKRYILLKKAKI